VVIEDAVYEERHSDPQKLLDAITATATKELVGFKLFRKHVPSHKLGEVLQWATHVIWLTREDRLAQYVSICLALKSGSWVQFEDAKDTAKELRVRGAALRHARKIGSVVLSDEYFRLWQGAQAEFAAYADGITTLLAVWKSTAAVLARSSGEEPASPRHRAGVASMASNAP
jgi:DNA topoisomerase IB